MTAYQEYYLCCDNCGVQYPEKMETVQCVRDDAEDGGWKVNEEGGIDTCPTCLKKYSHESE